MDAKKVKLISSALVVILLGVVIFQNYQPITVQILVASITMPLALLLALTFLIGLLAGWFFSLLRANKSAGKK